MNWKHFAIVSLIALVAVAITYRVTFLRNLVFGVA